MGSNEKIVFSWYFRIIGWTSERGNGEILWFDKKQLEAIKIQSDVTLIVDGWCPTDNALTFAGTDGVMGIQGKNKALSAIKIAPKEFGGVSIFYRVFLGIPVGQTFIEMENVVVQVIITQRTLSMKFKFFGCIASIKKYQ